MRQSGEDTVRKMDTTAKTAARMGVNEYAIIMRVNLTEEGEGGRGRQAWRDWWCCCCWSIGFGGRSVCPGMGSSNTSYSCIFRVPCSIIAATIIFAIFPYSAIAIFCMACCAADFALRISFIGGLAGLGSPERPAVDHKHSIAMWRKHIAGWSAIP